MADTSPFHERHRETLERAITAIAERDFWTPHPEVLKAYGEDADARGRAAFEAYLGNPFPLDQAGAHERVGAERSPYGLDLGITYPHPGAEEVVEAARAALPGWRDAGPQVRAGICLEILHRLNERSAEMAYAVMHTTGQAFLMAFQAGGPHAQDRGLEAVAYAYPELTRHPRTARWEKPMGRGQVAAMEKTFTAVPRGVALVIGCATFPTWNSYPGLFASLVTGNPVIVKPHPRAVLPLALTVRIARDVLADAGLDPDVVTLATDAPGEGIASALATHPAVRIVDFTGSTAYGEWLEEHAKQATTYTEKAGVNNVVIDSTDDFAGMCKNLAFSLSLYSGQMCTTPQNLLVPRDGIDTDEGRKSFDEVVAGLAAAVQGLLGDDKRAAAVLGAIVDEGVLERLDRAPSYGDVALASRTVASAEFPDATIRTPVIVTLGGTDEEEEKVYAGEHFGPISFAIPTGSTQESLDVLRRTVQAHGALTALVYSTREDVLDAAEDAARDAPVALSCNLTGGVYVNQSAAFSDFHGTGANPACNAALTDAAFVAGRFTMVQSRRPASLS